MENTIESLRQKVAAALDGVALKAQSDDEVRTELMAKLIPLGLDAQVGWILNAGQIWNGEFQVQFSTVDGSWASRWPEWAFNSARDALLHDKRIWVIFTDEPYGPKLLLTLVTNQRV